MTHTYQLIKLDSDLAASNWDPWTSLNLTAPMLDVRSGFNTREVKKAYRNMAKLYHPDKVANMKLNKTESVKYKKKWTEVVRSYETLTDEDKFENFLYYGNPEGSMVFKSFDMAIPQFFLEESNQIYILVALFATVVMIPAVIISRTADQEATGDFVDEYTPEAMTTLLMSFVDKNLSKK